MGRRELPLDMAAPGAQLALALRELRRSRRLTYRRLSRITHYSPSVLSRAASGRAVPSWEVVTAYVTGCLGTRAIDWTHWWLLWTNARVAAGGGAHGVVA